MKLGRFVALTVVILVSVVAPPHANAQELFGVNVVVLNQSGPVRIKEIQIEAGVPRLMLQNTTWRKVVTGVQVSSRYLPPSSCYDEQRWGSPGRVAGERVYEHPFTQFRPQSSVEVPFPGADWPLLLAYRRPATTVTVGYVHMQLSIRSVSFSDGTFWRARGRDYDRDLWEQDQPVCDQWKPIMPFLEDLQRRDILLQYSEALEGTKAGIVQSSEQGFLYTCSRVQTVEEPVFVCPNFSPRPPAETSRR